MDRKVICAAMRNSHGIIVLGLRHWDKLMHMHAHDKSGWEQGFIDQRYEFLTREEAWEVATAAGQIIRRVGGDEGRLYSENLY